MLGQDWHFFVALWQWSTLMQKHTCACSTYNTHFTSPALLSNLHLASGHLETLAFLTFIITRKNGTKWTKKKKKREIRRSAFIRGPEFRGWHTYTYSSCTWPSCDPHKFPTFRNVVRDTILRLDYMHVCVRLCIPL